MTADGDREGTTSPLCACDPVRDNCPAPPVAPPTMLPNVDGAVPWLPKPIEPKSGALSSAEANCIEKERTFEKLRTFNPLCDSVSTAS